MKCAIQVRIIEKGSLNEIQLKPIPFRKPRTRAISPCSHIQCVLCVVRWSAYSSIDWRLQGKYLFEFNVQNQILLFLTGICGIHLTLADRTGYLSLPQYSQECSFLIRSRPSNKNESPFGEYFPDFIYFCILLCAIVL